MDADQRIEIVISSLLRTGLIIASILVLVGGIFYLVRFGAVTPDYRTFHGEVDTLTSLRGVIRAAMDLDSRGVIQLGLLFLILTPIARVVFSAAAFLIRKDYLYTSVTLFVLGVLIYNLLKT